MISPRFHKNLTSAEDDDGADGGKIHLYES